MSGPTPGPWKVTTEWSHVGVGASIDIKAKDGTAVAGMCGSDEESDANARLIAAVPVLLNALEMFEAHHACTRCGVVARVAIRTAKDGDHE